MKANQRKATAYWTLNGDTHTLSEWATITGVPRRTLRARREYGWSIEQILTLPSGAHIRHKHAMGGFCTPTYRSWLHMRDRCLNAKSDNYARYGGRGITVCTRWDDFTNFLVDMGQRPKATSLERIDNSGNYEPTNCRWGTPKEQSNNTRYNRLLRFHGQSRNVTEWAAITGLSRVTIASRIRYGWPVERILGDAVMSRKEAALYASKSRRKFVDEDGRFHWGKIA